MTSGSNPIRRARVGPLRLETEAEVPDTDVRSCTSSATRCRSIGSALPIETPECGKTRYSGRSNSWIVRIFGGPVGRSRMTEGGALRGSGERSMADRHEWFLIDSPKAYLFTIARNLAVERARRVTGRATDSQVSATVAAGPGRSVLQGWVS